MRTFIDGFLEHNPQLRDRDFYIAGESYAGHYVPAIAEYFMRSVASTGKPLGLNLKGVAIGNGWVNPYVQYPYYAEFTHKKNLINQTQYHEFKSYFKKCQDMLADESVSPIEKFSYCQNGNIAVVMDENNFPKYNMYDIRQKCELLPTCYNFNNSVEYFN